MDRCLLTLYLFILCVCVCMVMQQIIITDTFKQIIDTVSDMPASKRDHIALGCVAGLDVLVIMPLAALRNITWLSASGYVNKLCSFTLLL